MADTLDLFRKIATLETELRIEKAQHAQAQQTIIYLSRQLAASPPEIVTDARSQQQHRVPPQQEHVVPEPQNTAVAITQHIPSSQQVPSRQHIGVHTRRNEAQMQHNDFQAYLNHIKTWTRTEEPRPASHGMNGSRWAQDRSSELVKIAKDEEKTVKQSPVVEDDLIKFPDDCEESDAAENGKNAPLDEAAERERQKEMQKTQAMLMFRPVAQQENYLRTVMATGIPPAMTVHEVMSLVSGGVIVSIQAMHTSPITGTESIMINFLHASSARNFIESAKDNKKPKFHLLNTPTWPLNRDLSDDITEAKHTRCLAIHNVDPDVSLDSLCVILAESGTSEHGIIHARRDSSGTVFLEFVSVVAAQKAYERARRHSWFRIAKVEFEADPCDWVVAKGQKAIEEKARVVAEEKEVGGGAEEKEIGGGVEEDADDEAEDGIDDAEKDARVGRKMDDHEIAAILADLY